MTTLTFTERAIQSGCKTLNQLADWPTTLEGLLSEYEKVNLKSDLTQMNLDLAYFVFDLTAERVVLAYAFSTPSLTKRDASRIRGFPNVNASVKKMMGDRVFQADKGHFLGHASGGTLDINLFPQRRELNRGWSEQGKRYRTMERYVADRKGTFFYSRPIYDDESWIPEALEFAVLTEERGWWIDLFNNRYVIPQNDV